MKKQIGQVITQGVVPVKLSIHHVGEPGHRVPVRPVIRGKCPGYTFTGQPVLHMGVFSDVDVIVVIYEVVAQYRIERDDGGHHDEKTYCKTM